MDDGFDRSYQWAAAQVEGIATMLTLGVGVLAPEDLFDSLTQTYGDSGGMLSPQDHVEVLSHLLAAAMVALSEARRQLAWER